MEVMYTSEGRQTMHIGARLPYQGEDLQAVVQMYAPVGYWLEQETQVQLVEIGATGTFVLEQSPEPTLESTKADKLAEIAAWRYNQEVKGLFLHEAIIQTDRESRDRQHELLASFKDGFITSANWKAADGTFVSLSIEKITEIVREISVFVQECFARERMLVDQVSNAQTIAEVQSIDPKAIFPEPFGSIPTTEM
jgi:hypothetical protein